MNLNEQLNQIIPGKTYPSYVKIVEKKDNMIVEFYLNSFFVGMYCAIHVNGQLVGQNGDKNNKTFCDKLKKDIKKALVRGSTVEIGPVRNCQLTFEVKIGP